MRRSLSIITLAVATLLLSACNPAELFSHRSEAGTVHGFYVSNNGSTPVFVRQSGYQTYLYPGDMDHFLWDTRPAQDSVMLVFGADDTVWHRINRLTMTHTPAQHNLFDSTAYIILDTIEFTDWVSPDASVHGHEVRHFFLIGDSDH